MSIDNGIAPDISGKINQSAAEIHHQSDTKAGAFAQLVHADVEIKSESLFKSLNLPKEKFIGNSKRKTIMGAHNVGTTLWERTSTDLGFKAPASTPDGNLPIIKTHIPAGPDLSSLPMPAGIDMGPSFVFDTFRHYSGKYWTFDAEGVPALKDVGNTAKKVESDNTTASSGNVFTALKNAIPLNPEAASSLVGVGVIPKTLKFLNPFFGGQPDALHSPFSSIDVVYVDSDWAGTQPGQVQKKTIVSVMQNKNITPLGLFNNPTLESLDDQLDRVWAALINGQYQGEVYSGDKFGIIPLNVPFVDCVFDVATPFEVGNIENFESKKNSFIKLEPVYNFYARKYEEILLYDFVPESVLPSIQAVNALYSSLEPNNVLELGSNPYFGLGGIGEALMNQGGTSFDPKKIGSDLFQKMADKYAGVLSTMAKILDSNTSKKVTPANKNLVATFNALRKEWMNIVVPYTDIDLLKNSDRKRFFPMYFNLQFATDISTEFTDSLQGVPFGIQLLINVISDVINGDYKAMPYTDVSELSFTKKDDSGGKPKIEKRLASKDVLYKYWNMEQWIKQSGFFEWKYNSSNQQSYMTLKGTVDKYALLSRKYSKKDYLDELNSLHGTDAPSGFSQIIYSLAFLAKYEEFVASKLRTYKDILAGKKAYAETVMYRIAKTRLNDAGEKIGDTQNIWVPNTNSLDTVEYIDTQVKYNKEYVYEVFAYELVIGNQYTYKNIENAAALTKFVTNLPGYEGVENQGEHNPVPYVLPNGGNLILFKSPVMRSAVFEVEEASFVKLVEVPYGEVKGKIVDHPPISPDVDLIPYAGINNRMLININGGLGEYKAPPIFIEPEDSLVMQADIDPETGLVHFKSDDSISNSGFFEVFRTDQMPFSYADFRGTKIANVRTDIESCSKLHSGAASSAGFLDTTIQPNTKYWYMFRTVDLHGNISNPSPVFQIEIVDDRQSIYFLNEVFQFPEKMMNLTSTTVKKYLQISPAYLQSIMKHSGTDDEKEATNVLEDMSLGIRDQSVWGKRFKIRITSRQTGRKIDLNVKFEMDKFNKTEKHVQDVNSLTDPNK
tara:strand:+ start:9 stop:3200 length:3192 start_codon:yes stop_codon:yes gene_type:complete